ncbi:MAG: SHOCT domain-containing protein [Candidatus Hodarchaeales archaeon]|jgi:hypothetical protein
MSELIKAGYRGIGGFFIVIFVFTFGVTGIALLISGAAVLAFSWVPKDPVLAFVILLFIAALLIALGGAFSAGAFYLGKGAIFVDRGLSQAVDRNVPSIREIVASRSSDRITRLERLGELREKGLLTEEEFQREKAHIMKEPAPTAKIPTCSSCSAPIEQDDLFCPRCGSKL